MVEKLKKELQMTTVTIAISAAAMVMGIVAFAIAAINGRISWIGIIVAGAMAVNIFPAVKRRKAITAEIKKYEKRQ